MTDTRRTVADAPDATLAEAIDLAREAAVEEAGADLVGEHIGLLVEDDRVVTHLFACLSPGYRSWNWAVTVTRAPRTKHVTVNDVVLLPGADALLAPPWVPWSERVKPGDLGVGDLLPTLPDDPRLVPGYTDADSLEGVGSLTPLGFGAWEIGLGRERVLSDIGRIEAAERWMSTMGPDTSMARQAPLTCSTCGFLLALGGPVGHLFGVCANEMSPADGHVVAMTFGCGAHSQVQVEQSPVAAGDVIVVAEDDIEAVDLDTIPDPEPETSTDVDASTDASTDAEGEFSFGTDVDALAEIADEADAVADVALLDGAGAVVEEDTAVEGGADLAEVAGDDLLDGQE